MREPNTSWLSFERDTHFSEDVVELDALFAREAAQAAFVNHALFIRHRRCFPMILRLMPVGPARFLLHPLKKITKSPCDLRGIRH